LAKLGADVVKCRDPPMAERPEPFRPSPKNFARNPSVIPIVTRTDLLSQAWSDDDRIACEQTIMMLTEVSQFNNRCSREREKRRILRIHRTICGIPGAALFQNVLSGTQGLNLNQEAARVHWPSLHNRAYGFAQISSLVNPVVFKVSTLNGIWISLAHTTEFLSQSCEREQNNLYLSPRQSLRQYPDRPETRRSYTASHSAAHLCCCSLRLSVRRAAPL
jgi:hypothetical protein